MKRLSKNIKSIEVTKLISYIFWIQSSRGTREIQTIQLPNYLSKERIKDELEIWCSRFGAWHVSENVCSYGFLKDTKFAQRKIDQYYRAQGMEHQKIDECIHKKITPEHLSKWFKKNKKALQFPFK